MSRKKKEQKEPKVHEYIEDVFKIWKYAHVVWNIPTTTKYYPDEKEYFVRDKMYTCYEKFNRFCDVYMVDKLPYLKYLIFNKVKYNQWTKYEYLQEYIKNMILLESKDKAIKRSNKFIKNNNLDMSTISINRLKFYIVNGIISPWILFKKYPETLKRFDKYDLEECQPLLDLKIWKLKLENE